MENRLFKKIAACFVGLTLTLGVGVVATSIGKSVVQADAATTEIVFNLGANGSASHSDGSSKTTYTETVNGYTLTLSNVSGFYTGARDALGNSCIKLGSGKNTGGFSFTAPGDVTSVIIAAGKYKNDTTKLQVNGTTYNLTNASNNGAYDEITVDTTTSKTVKVTTLSDGKRAMINAITFIVESSEEGVKYNIELYSNNSFNETKTETIDGTIDGALYDLPENDFTVEEGKTFIGWKIGTEDKILDAGEQINVTSDTTKIYAQWGNVYTVTYEAGEHGTGVYEETNVLEGDYVLKNYSELTGFSTEDGYVFANYIINGLEKNPGETISIVENTTISVIFKEVEGLRLVENQDDLQIGNQIVISNKDSTYALGTQRDNNRAGIPINITGELLFPTEDIEIITLEEGSIAGTYSLATDDGYLSAVSSDSNYLRVNAKKDSNSSWSISIEEGIAKIVAQGVCTRNTMQFNLNNNNPIFACYASASQTPLKIYSSNIKEKVVENVTYTDEDAKTVYFENEIFDSTNYVFSVKYEGIDETTQISDSKIVWNIIRNSEPIDISSPLALGDKIQATVAGFNIEPLFVNIDVVEKINDIYTGELSVKDNDPVEKTIESIAAENGWVNGTAYKNIEIDNQITAIASGDGNTAKYYSSGHNWRFYQTDDSQLKFTAKEGSQIKKIAITYSSTNSGILVLNGNNIDSGTEIEVNSSEVLFGVGNTGSATNGQVRITSIKVVSATGSDTRVFYSNKNALAQKTALDFVRYFNETLGCDANGNTEDITGKWSKIKKQFDAALKSLELKEDSKNNFINLFVYATAISDKDIGFDTADPLQKMLGLYNYVVDKYESLDDFLASDEIGRTDAPNVLGSNLNLINVNVNNSNGAALVIVITSIISVCTLAYFFINKKKKENTNK